MRIELIDFRYSGLNLLASSVIFCVPTFELRRAVYRVASGTLLADVYVVAHSFQAEM